VTRRRPLKAYVTRGRFRKADMPKIPDRHDEGVQLLVATTSKRDAARLCCVRFSDWDWSGTITGNEDDRAAALAQPGRVLWRNSCNSTHDGDWRPWDGQDEAVAAWTASVERAAARKIEAAERQARFKAERLDIERRKRETRRKVDETLEQLRPLLADLGIHPDSAAVGIDLRSDHSMFSVGDRVGLLLPAEAVELLVAKALELEKLMAS
jgi:hypothetical protein